MNYYAKIVSVLLAGVVLFFVIHLTLFRRASSKQVSQSIDDQLIQFLQDYIQIDTTTQHADYKKACTFLKEHAQKDDFLYQEVLLPSGNSAVIITQPGNNTSLPALALNHHMDVVPVPNPEEWKVPPFSGAIVEGSMIGRGTQDMKGIGAVHYYALKELKEKGFVFERTVHILAVPDEERGGFLGTKELVETEEFNNLRIGFVVDEALSTAQEGIMNIKIDERKPLQIKVTSVGTLAHGSQLMADNALHHLIEFANEIVGLHRKGQKNGTRCDHGLCLSTNITSLQAGAFKDGKVAYNVIPNKGEATIDIRIPPATSIESIKQELDRLCEKYPAVKYEVAYSVEEREPRKGYNTVLYKSMEKALAFHGVTARPQVTEGASDLRFHLRNGLDGIGITPFTVADNIHGTNESVPIAELIKGKNIFVTFIQNFCK